MNMKDNDLIRTICVAEHFTKLEVIAHKANTSGITLAQSALYSLGRAHQVLELAETQHRDDKESARALSTVDCGKSPEPDRNLIDNGNQCPEDVWATLTHAQRIAYNSTMSISAEFILTKYLLKKLSKRQFKSIAHGYAMVAAYNAL